MLQQSFLHFNANCASRPIPSNESVKKLISCQLPESSLQMLWLLHHESLLTRCVCARCMTPSPYMLHGYVTSMSRANRRDLNPSQREGTLEMMLLCKTTWDMVHKHHFQLALPAVRMRGTRRKHRQIMLGVSVSSWRRWRKVGTGQVTKLAQSVRPGGAYPYLLDDYSRLTTYCVDRPD